MGTGKLELRFEKSWVLYIAIFYFFVFRDYLENVIGLLQYVDEAVALMAVPLFLINLRNHKFRIEKIKKEGYVAWLIIFLMAGLVGNVLYRYQPFVKAVLPDALLNLKFWLAIYTGSCLYRGFDTDRYAGRMFRHIKFITWLFTALILADWVWKLFPTEVRYGIRSTKLFFSHPTVVAAVSAYIIALLMSIWNHTGRKGTAYCIWWLVILCSTMRSKAWGAAMAMVLVYYFAYVRKKKITVRVALMFVPLILVLGWSQLEFYFLSDIQSGSARYQLLSKSLMIMKDCFPVGTGFGTYACYYSSVVYSPVYAKYGISKIQGLEKGAASFVSDSFWPMIFGQTGIQGTMAFLMALWKLYKKIQSMRVCNRAYYVSAICILAYVLISSMAESAFSHPLMIPMALWLGCLLKGKNSVRANLEIIDGWGERKHGIAG